MSSNTRPTRPSPLPRRALNWAGLVALAILPVLIPAGGALGHASMAIAETVPEPVPPAVARLSRALRMADLAVIFRDEGLASADDLATSMLGDARPQGWDATVAQIYDPARFQSEFDQALAQALSNRPSEEQTAMAEFFETHPGRTLAQTEVTARRALLDAGVEAQAKSLWSQMQAKTPARAALLNRLVLAGDLVDANVEATMNADLAFYRAMARTAHPDRTINDSDLLAQIAAQEGDVRSSTAEWLYPFMALAYRDLPDADLASYAAFAESGAGRQLNRAMFAAFDDVYARISTELGRAVAQALVGQDI